MHGSMLVRPKKEVPDEGRGGEYEEATVHRFYILRRETRGDTKREERHAYAMQVQGCASSGIPSEYDAML